MVLVSVVMPPWGNNMGVGMSGCHYYTMAQTSTIGTKDSGAMLGMDIGFLPSTPLTTLQGTPYTIQWRPEGP